MTEADQQPELSAAWRRRWGSARPVGHELRTAAPDRWVRFHTLPDAQRYATSAAGRAEVLTRHHALLSTLVATAGSDVHGDHSEDEHAGDGGEADPGRTVLVVTCSWGGPDPIARQPEVVEVDPDARPWRRERTDPDDGDGWTHLWVSRRPWREGALDGLLELVAEDRTGGVVVAHPSFAWLYHPYDGGADVLVADLERLAAMTSRHGAWRSRHPAGL